MYLTDMQRIREQYRDEVDRISFIQRQRWHDTITLLLKFQNRQSQLIFDDYITTFILSHLKDVDSTQDEAWFWSKSELVQRTEIAHADVRKGLEQAGF